MHIIISSATEMEHSLLQKKLKHLDQRGITINFHTSGVGVLQSTYAFTSLLLQNKPDLIIQCGIAGGFDDTLLKQAVVVEKDFYASCGVEEQALWRDMFDMGFAHSDTFPFQDKALESSLSKTFPLSSIKLVTAVTVDEVTTNTRRIAFFQKKYAAQIETMEGASFHYVCLQNNVPFLQIRGISNKVGDRDKSNWYISEALNNMTIVMIDFLKQIIS